MKWLFRDIESESDSLLSQELKRDLKALADQVPEPDFSQVRLQAAIQSRTVARASKFHRTTWVLAPVCAAALALVVLPRFMQSVNDQTPAVKVPITDSNPVQPAPQPTMEKLNPAPEPPIAPVPPVHTNVVPERVVERIAPAPRKHRPIIREGSVAKVAVKSIPKASSAKTIEPSDLANTEQSSPNDSVPVAMATAPGPSETTVEITATQSEHGLSVAREVENSNDVVIGG